MFAVVLLSMAQTASAQLDFEREPISYGVAPVDDPVVRLQQQIDSGEIELNFDEDRGYLPAVLDLLEIPQSSQVLVFSKTSFQLRRISPQRPRALYFNDQNFLGWVQHGDVLEVMSVDPNQGPVFYTLDQRPVGKPQFIRDRGQCLSCHASSRTQGVPGALVRSVFVDPRGQPLLGSGTFTIDHRSPFKQRWGGWYVSGTHGMMRHMGNVTANDRDPPEHLDVEAGANRTDLRDLLDTSPYLTPHSDLVALMVLEHQSQMQNLLTRANYEARSAAHHDGIMNEALARPADYVSETTQRRVASVGDNLLHYLLMGGEFELKSPIAGASDFAKEFSARGPRDSQGRSLRDLDLQHRLFKYPCSYLIDSPSFDALPATVKSYVTGRLKEILAGHDPSREYAYLTAADRQAIREILQETKPELWE